MELLFIWVKQFRALSDANLNFSNANRFHFDTESKTLSIQPSENFIPKFFGENISNLTGIIGENGTGKTSILRYILQYCTDGVNEDDKDAILVFKDNALNYYYYSSFDIVVQGSFNLSLIKRVSNLEQFKNTVTSIYLSNHFDTSSFYSNEYTNTELRGIKNLSTYYLLHSDIETRLNVSAQNSAPPFKLMIESFAIQEFKRIVKVLRWINNGTERNPFPVKSPPFLNLSLYFNRDSPNKELQAELTRMLDEYFQIRGSKQNIFLLRAFEAGIYHLIDQSRFIAESAQIKDYFKEIGDRVKHFLLDKRIKRDVNASVMSRISAIFKDITVSDNKIVHEQLLQIQTFLTFLDEFLKTKSTRVSENGSVLSIRISDANVKKLEDLIDEFYRIDKIGDYADFYFSHAPFGESSLSSGEYALLSLVGRLNSIKLEKNQSILLLIDEAELALHPQWQKQFVSLLTDFIAERFKQLSVQIVITSHSPFILSDLPPHCNIFLRKKNGKTQLSGSLDKFPETFGANIHELFTDSFFLQNGLMGEFARQKIDDLVKEVFEKQEFDTAYYDRVRRLVNIIGEPFVRQKIIEKIMSGMKLPEVDYVILDRERELERLKKIRDDQNRNQ